MKKSEFEDMFVKIYNRLHMEDDVGAYNYVFYNDCAPVEHIYTCPILAGFSDKLKADYIKYFKPRNYNVDSSWFGALEFDSKQQGRANILCMLKEHVLANKLYGEY